MAGSEDSMPRFLLLLLLSFFSFLALAARRMDSPHKVPRMHPISAR